MSPPLVSVWWLFGSCDDWLYFVLATQLALCYLPYSWLWLNSLLRPHCWLFFSKRYQDFCCCFWTPSVSSGLLSVTSDIFQGSLSHFSLTAWHGQLLYCGLCINSRLPPMGEVALQALALHQKSRYLRVIFICISCYISSAKKQQEENSNSFASSFVVSWESPGDRQAGAVTPSPGNRRQL